MREFILEYVDLQDDRKRILQVLAENDIGAIESEPNHDLYKYIVIRVRGVNKLKWIVDKLNQVCEYGVKVVKRGN